MQIRHQLVTGAMGIDQRIVHVIGVRRGETNTLQPIDLIQVPNQARKTTVVTVIGVNVLAQQRDFPHAGFHQFLGLTHDTGSGSRYFGAAGVGHHTERAKFITAFLHGQKRRWAALGFAAGFQGVEFVVVGKISIKRTRARLHRVIHSRQSVIGLRPHNQIDHWLTADNFFALGLCHTTGHTNFQIRVRGLKMLKTAQF